MINENEIIKIDTNEDWIRVQEILFYYKFIWLDTGKEIFLRNSKEFPKYIYINEYSKMIQTRFSGDKNVIDAEDYIKKFETPLLRKEKLLKLKENECSNKNT